MSKHKESLATSQEVFNRITWDPSFDASRFEVAWRQRSGELELVPLLEWRPDMIPWHRVEQILCEGELVWGRAERIDLISTGAWLDRSTRDTPPHASGSSGGPLGAPGVDPLPSWSWRAGRWRADEARDEPGSLPVTLRVASYNVLRDSLAAHHTSPELRRDAIAEELRVQDADLIALQEVEPSFSTHLRQLDWVQEGYHISVSHAATSVTPYGQVLLSRWPMRCGLVSFSPQKRALLAEVDIAGRAVCVAVLHLTSSLARDAENKRAEQLERIVALTSSVEEVIVLGDFNLSHELDHQALFAAHDLVDVWSELKPDDPGETFVPAANTMAARTSKSGRRARFDRILWRRSKGTPYTMEIFGDTLLPDGIHPSDHWGVVATLGLASGGAVSAPPVVRSALVLVPPQRCWPVVQEIRGEHDHRRLARWMPHITLLYPFVPERHFVEAAERLSEVTSRFEPVEVELGELGTFVHEASTTVWASVAPGDVVCAMQSALQAKLPRCDEQSTRGDEGYTPHLTLGSIKHGASHREHLMWCEHRWKSQRFIATEVALISRRGEEGFEIRGTLPLGEQTALAVLLDESHDVDEAGVERAIDVARDALSGPGAAVELIGSHALGAALSDADIDLLVVISPARHTGEVLDVLAEALRTHSKVTDVMVVRSGYQPTLRAGVGEHVLDIQVAVEGSDDAVSRRAIECARVARSLVDRCAAHGAEPLLAPVTRWLKLWAKRRGVYGAAWGFWGGIAWAAVASWAVAGTARLGHHSIERAIEFAFHALAEFAWPATFGLAHARHFDAPGDWMPVVAPGAPELNLTRGMTTSTARILREEFAAAAAMARLAVRGRSGWRGMLEHATPAASSSALWLCVIALDGDRSSRTMAGLEGLVRGKILGLMIEFEHLGTFEVRPWPEPVREANSRRWRIDLRGASATALELARQAARAWADGLVTQHDITWFEISIEVT